MGGTIFPAHKAVVAARSPVFNKIFTTEMLESKTDQVKIDDIQPDIFEIFLKFLYSGMLTKTSTEKNQQLLYVAEKYQVETLTNIC